MDQMSLDSRRENSILDYGSCSAAGMLADNANTVDNANLALYVKPKLYKVMRSS